jgi:hypothetical protein
MNDDLLSTARVLVRGNPWAYVVWFEGLSDQEVLALYAQLGIDALNRAAEAVLKMLRELWEAFKTAMEAIVEFIQTAAREIFNLPSVRRLLLYFDLKQRWHVPDRLALWLARRCPLRWLPAP